MNMVTCYIGIGSNLGDRQATIDKAIGMLSAVEGIRVDRVSTIYETDPVSDIPQGRYLNGVVAISTGLSPRGLLGELIRIETGLGRTRQERNAPRTIDLDILYFGSLHMREEGLVIPHPRVAEREFVLKGLRELAPRLAAALNKKRSAE